MASNDQEPTTNAGVTYNTSGTNGHQGHTDGGKQHPAPPADSQPGPVPAEEPQKAVKKGPNPLALVIIAVIIIVGIVYGLKFYHYSQTHVSTDDAYITGDLINVSPIIAGTLEHLKVDEGDYVHKGQLIAQLDDSGPNASYQQALAAQESALSQIPQAETNIEYEQSSVNAQIAQAQAALRAQNAKVSQEQDRFRLTQRTVGQQILQAQAQSRASDAQILTALQQLQTALKAVQTARDAAAAAHSQVGSYQANATKAHKDAVRYASLYGPNGSIAAITAQQNDAAQAAEQSANAQLAAAQNTAAQADGAVEQALAQVNVAKANVASARDQAAASQANVGVAQANRISIPVQQGSINNNQQLVSQQVAELQAAQAQQQQVTLRAQQLATARYQAQAAAAAAKTAKVTLDDTVILAPVDGTIVKKGANAGDALTPGQTIVTMTQGSNVWVEANFKETQLEGVKPGQSAEVEVDAFPHKVFLGKVLSINEASGNAISLFPADNATGNFTKVVMRIPVKIALIPAKDGNTENYATRDDIFALRQGMSVNATIDLR